MLKWLSAAVLAAYWGGVAMAAEPTTSSAAALGTWGGDRLQLTVEAHGARLAMDCASGSISVPLVLDAHGSFTAGGKFETHQPGPQQADDSGGVATRYSGSVKGEQMTLTIHASGAAAPQHYTLRKGVQIKLVRCL